MHGKRRKMFYAENIFRENDFSENIFRRKLFYVEVNGASILFHKMSLVEFTLHVKNVLGVTKWGFYTNIG
jgi:hypothetical protein